MEDMADQSTQTEDDTRPQELRIPLDGEKTPRVGGASGQKVLATRKVLRKTEVHEPGTIKSYRLPPQPLIVNFKDGKQEVVPSKEHNPSTGAIPVPHIRDKIMDAKDNEKAFQRIVQEAEQRERRAARAAFSEKKKRLN